MIGRIGQLVAEEVAQTCTLETRITVRGHLRRGGSPTPFDRWRATRFGAGAVRLAARQMHDYFVGLRGTEIVEIRLGADLKVPKRVDLDGDVVRTAKDPGVCLGQ